MKKINYGTAAPALLFSGLLAILSIWNILLPQKDFSTMENRELAKFPAISEEKIRTGEWMDSFELYSSDQFLFRDGFMRVKTAADLAFRRRDNGRVYFGKDGYLFSTDRVDEKQKASNLTLTAALIRRLKEQRPHTRFSFLLAPTAISTLADKLPAHAPVSDERAAINQAESYLKKETPYLIFTDPSGALIRAAASPAGHSLAVNGFGSELDSGSDPAPTQLYYRTDHHWTTDGAYVAYRQWAADNGFEPYGRDYFQRETVSDSFYGTNQSKAHGVSVKGDRIVRYGTPNDEDRAFQLTVWKDITKPEETETRSSFYDERFLKTKDQYGYFLGGNDPQVRIQTPVRNGRRLLLIKDSYANCMVPFLALHYEEIYITDLRYSHGKLVIPQGADKNITDIMLLYNVESFSTDRNLAYTTQLNLP